MRHRTVQDVIRFSVPVKIRNTRQAPRSRNTRPVGTTDKHIVVQEPNRCLAGAGIEKDEIGIPVEVKIAGCHQRPAHGQGRAIMAADKRHPRKIPKRRLARASVNSA